MATGKNEKVTKLLQLVQGQAGVSRRKAQELIEAGEVESNGRAVRDPFISLKQETIETLRLRGHPLSLLPLKYRAYRYYKPTGQLCSHDDPHCGDTVGRVLRAEGFIGYTWAGRLDQDAEGLMLLTNDGKIVQCFTHPRYQVKKVYHFFISHFPSTQEMRRIFVEMHRGIKEGGETLRILSGEVGGRPTRAILTLAEGKKHEIKRLFGHFDFRVIRLKRVAIGPVELADLAPGEIARLKEEEMDRLYHFVRSLSST